MEDVSVVGAITTRAEVSARWTQFILFSKSGIEDLPTYVENNKYNKTCLNMYVSQKGNLKILSHLKLTETNIFHNIFTS